MQTSSDFLLTIGAILFSGLIISAIGQRTRLPRVTLLLLFGIGIGHSGLNLIPEFFTEQFDVIANITLILVGFLLGSKINLSKLKYSAKQLLWISLTAAIMTTLLTGLLLQAVGLSTEVSIILGCIAAATAPAAVYDVIAEMKSDSHFSKLLLAIVAVDDAWALIIFSIGMAVVASLNGINDINPFMNAFFEIGGAILLGGLIGIPAALLTGRIKKGEPLLTEAIALTFLCGGLAIYFEVSFLIAAMTMGIVISNTAKHHDFPFHEIEDIESIIMVVFFVIAGALLDINALQSLGIIGFAYIAGRTSGKIIGAAVGGLISNAVKPVKQWIGIALLPQAGVPVGMALLAANQFPQYKQILLSVMISSTVFFEIVGPILTRLALKKANDQSVSHARGD